MIPKIKMVHQKYIHCQKKPCVFRFEPQSPNSGNIKVRKKWGFRRFQKEHQKCAEPHLLCSFCGKSAVLRTSWCSFWTPPFADFNVFAVWALRLESEYTKVVLKRCLGQINIARWFQPTSRMSRLMSASSAFLLERQATTLGFAPSFGESIRTHPIIMSETGQILRVGFWQKGFFANLNFGAAGFFARIFLPDLFSSFL